MSLCVHGRSDCLCGRPQLDRIDLPLMLDEKQNRTATALDLVRKYAGIDGGHHKMWTIDQMVRALCGTDEKYEAWVKEYCAGEDGPDTYYWDKGIAP